jgi:acyl-coenzyme A synthetase/AMP-(fatty) acid ligase
MILSQPDEIKKKYDVSSMRQLLISSAPARKDTKMAIMEYFKNAELWEAYGSTEAGLCTLLRPAEQFKKLGSIGREIWGADRIKIDVVAVELTRQGKLSRVELIENAVNDRGNHNP